MSTTQRVLYKELDTFCKNLEEEFGLIPTKRKKELKLLRNYLLQKSAEKKIPQLIVICTHNSRRSHIGQIWLAVGVSYYQLPEIRTFSGGTEATAFNIRAVNALQKIGFKINSTTTNQENPVYNITWNAAMKPYQAFSKKYEDAPNPTTDFGAIMVCSQADESCPLVTGCDFRLALPYDDPKAFDDTEMEAEKYSERIRQIGREMLFMLSEEGLSFS